MQPGDVLELQFLDDIADPALAEGFPGDRGHRTRTEQRPQRHFDRTGVGRRYHTDPVVGGHFKHVARQFDRELELGLADFRAVRTAKSGISEILGVPAGALGTGAGRKMRHVRPQSGLRCSHDLSFQIESLPLGGGVPPRCIGELPEIVKDVRNDHLRWMIRHAGGRAASKSQRHADMARLKSEPDVETLGIDSGLVGEQFDQLATLAAGLGDRPLHHLLADAAAAATTWRRERPRSGRARRPANSVRAGCRAAGSRPHWPRHPGRPRGGCSDRDRPLRMPGNRMAAADLPAVRARCRADRPPAWPRWCRHRRGGHGGS